MVTADLAIGQLQDQMQFTSYASGATPRHLAIMPVPEPVNVALTVFGAACVVFGFGRRFLAQRREAVERRSSIAA